MRKKVGAGRGFFIKKKDKQCMHGWTLKVSPLLQKASTAGVLSFFPLGMHDTFLHGRAHSCVHTCMFS